MVMACCRPGERFFWAGVLREGGVGVDDGASGLLARGDQPGPVVSCGEFAVVGVDDMAAGSLLCGGADGVGHRRDGS